MVDLSNVLKIAKELANKAVTLDKDGKYSQSYEYYVKAAEKLQYLIKVDQNPYNRESYNKKAKEYCERARKIKGHPDKIKAEAIGGVGKAGDDSNDEDEKLKGQLSNCLITEKPNVKWDDVAGLEKAKEALKEAVVLPIKFPQLFKGKRKPWKGILLYGPPGTGKSFLAKAAATETGGKFFSVSAANIVSKFMGESERLVKGLFDLARKNKPAVIFMDEIDSCLSARGENDNDATRRLKTEFLVQMQGVGNDDEGILVLGATNIPWCLDPAVRRRFQKKIYIGLPDEIAREKMFRLDIGKTPNDLTDQDFIELAQETKNYSGSDISTLTQDAVYEPLRTCEKANYFRKVVNPNNPKDYNYTVCNENDKGAMQMTMISIPEPEKLMVPKVSRKDYEKALKKIKPTVNLKDLEKQDEFTKEFGQEG